MVFSKHNWAMISKTICPEMLIFGNQTSWTLFFQNILTNPIISEISFLWRHILVLYGNFFIVFLNNSINDIENFNNDGTDNNYNDNIIDYKY